MFTALQMATIATIQRIAHELAARVDALAVTPDSVTAAELRGWWLAREATLTRDLYAYLDGLITPAAPGLEGIVRRVPPGFEGMVVEKKAQGAGVAAAAPPPRTGLPLPGETLAGPPETKETKEYKLPVMKVSEYKFVTPTDTDYDKILDACCAHRVGIIPYTYVADRAGKATLYFLLGTKPPYPDIPKIVHRTDFGGSCHLSENEPVFDCGLREFSEETGGAVAQPDRKDLTILLLGQGVGRRLWVMLLYNYKGTKDIPFVPNKELISINWYTVDQMYGRWPAGVHNDRSLTHLYYNVPKMAWTALPT